MMGDGVDDKSFVLLSKVGIEKSKIFVRSTLLIVDNAPCTSSLFHSTTFRVQLIG